MILDTGCAIAEPGRYGRHSSTESSGGLASSGAAG
jgi:hypothetical protein